MATLLGLVLPALESGAQNSQTNIITANVTPSSFTVIWRGLAGATPDIRVFADEAGTQSLEGPLGVEPYPVHTGYAGATNRYEKRLSKTWLRRRQVIVAEHQRTAARQARDGCRKPVIVARIAQEQDPRLWASVGARQRLHPLHTLLLSGRVLVGLGHQREPAAAVPALSTHG